MTAVLANIQTGTGWGESLPRLGQISFINSLPIVLPVQSGHVAIAAQTIYGSPSELNAMYASNQLDMGAMSSFYFLQTGNLQLVPDISISSDGPVGSVLFFSKVSPHKLNGAKIAVPASSATSVNLLKILLAEQLNCKPIFCVESEPSLEGTDVLGALVIGDRALAFDNEWSRHYWRADLGQWWQARTGLPMVFGVWAARQEWAARNEQHFLAICNTLRLSAQLGLSSLFPLVMNEARNRTALPPDRLQRYYFKELNFHLGERHRRALELFADLCRKHGIFSCL